MTNYDDIALIKKGFHNQKSAIWALVFKEYKIRLGKSRIGLFWALTESIFGMIAMSAIWYAGGRSEVHGIHVSLYIGSGFLLFNTIRLGIGYIPHAIDANVALLNYPQVKPLDTILARFIQGVWMQLWSAVLLFGLLWWIIGVLPTFPDPLMCISATFKACLMALGLGLILAVFGTLNLSLLKFVAIISQPLMLLSCVIFSPSDIPLVAQEILAYNPIVHVLDEFRAGAFGTKLFAFYDGNYPLYFGLLCIGFGCAFYYRYRFRLLQQ